MQVVQSILPLKISFLKLYYLILKKISLEGKMDLMQTSSLNGFDTKIIGCTNDYSITKDSDIAVITSGIPRKPGMTREVDWY